MIPHDTCRKTARSNRFATGLTLAAVLLFGVSCTSPQRYLHKGNLLFDAGNYAEASINYRKAIQKDSRLGEAYYRLGESELKLDHMPEAYASLEHAAALLTDREDVKLKLADLCLSIYMSDPRRPARPYQALVKLSDELLARNANSYDGLRIKGMLAWTDGKLQMAEDLFRRADSIKPGQPELITAWSQALIQDGQFEEGERRALDLMRSRKDYGPVYDVLFRYYAGRRRAADALNILKTKMANNPNELRFALDLASWYAGAGRKAEMTALLQQLIANSKVFPDARLRVGDFYADLQDWPEAIHQYEEGARFHPKERINYLKHIADAKLAQGKGPEAAGILAEILKAQPQDETAKAVNATLLLRSGKPEKMDAGLKDLQELVKKSPGNPIWRLTLGSALLAKGDLDGAESQFRESIRKRDDLIPPRLALAEISQRRQDYKQMLQYADEVLSVRPDLTEAKLLRASALAGTQQFKEARSVLAKLEAQSPRNSEVQFQFAALNFAEGKFRDAELRLLKLLASGNSQKRALQGLIGVYGAQNRLDQAAALLDSELKKSPGSETIGALLAETALRDGKYNRALELYRQLTEKNPQSSQYQRLLGVTYQVTGDLPQAIARFQKARELAPGDPAATAALADALRIAGRRPEAIASYRRLLEISPENAYAMNNLAFLLADGGGTLDEAQKLAERALKHVPNEPRFSDTLGMIYVKRNLGDSAVQVFQALARKYPGDPLIHYHYGLALVQNGQKARAKSELENALLKSPAKDVQNNIQTTLSQLNRTN